MRKIYLSRTLISLSLAFFTLLSCQRHESEYPYLEDVLESLESIKSANYYLTGSASAPGDTMSFSAPRYRYVKEFVNPADTNVGASSIQYNADDTTRIQDFYDGMVRGSFNWEKQTIKVDSFQDHPYPFRLVYFPFYTKTKSIIKYALETEDSIKIVVDDMLDSLKFSLLIYDQVVEFVTKPFVDKHPHESSIGKVSQYDIWINKSDNLPYRMRRKMDHNTSFNATYKAEINTDVKTKFISSQYFPDSFKIEQFVRQRRKPVSDLLNTTAQPWQLESVDGDIVKMDDLKSKVLLIQFTGVGCGPCHQSIPFLKRLVKDYNDKSFEFVAIETWSDNMKGLIRYKDMNGLNFKFLKIDEACRKAYQVQAVPAFFVLDENRTITKVISGYSKGDTDEKILDEINRLL